MISFRLGRPGIIFKQNWLLFLLWLFLLVFPKGGIKIANVPITWGYLFIGLSSFLLAIRSIQTCSSLRLYAYLASIPFQVVAIPALLFRAGEFGYTIAFVISFYFFPLFFFLLASHPIDSLDMELFFKFLQFGVLIIAIYGLFLFAFKFMTGKFIEVPLLTTNLHDLDILETKCNQRAAFLFKLVSTYNNGNIYGVCLLMLLPLYDYREKSLWRKSIVKLSVILTLSRTVWIGFIFYELIRALFIEKKSRMTIIKIILILAGFFLFISLFQLIGNLGFHFLFDATLGGRRSNFAVFENLSFFPSSFHVIGEMVYLSILGQFGIGGFFCFLLAMLAPLFLFFSRGTKKTDQTMYRSILCSIINYLFVCLSDGAMLLIPTMAFYWFFCSFLLRKPLYTEITSEMPSFRQMAKNKREIKRKITYLKGRNNSFM